MSKGISKKIEKLKLNYADLFLQIKDLKERHAVNNGEIQLDLGDQKDQLQGVFESIRKLALSIDQSLTGLIGAEEAKAQKGLENLEKRIRKSKEQKHATAFNQIESIKSRLFPGDNLQERHDNFLNFYINDPNFLENILSEFDPFDFRFHILIEN